ncbi:unnamed protein product, partial [Cuscuta epithymum]
MWRLGQDCTEQESSQGERYSLPEYVHKLSLKPGKQLVCFLVSLDSHLLAESRHVEYLRVGYALGESFFDLFVDVFTNLPNEQLCTFAMMAWSIWRSRNTLYWEGNYENDQQVIFHGTEVLNSLVRFIGRPHTKSCASLAAVKWIPTTFHVLFTFIPPNFTFSSVRTILE